MIDPSNITNFNLTDNELQEVVLFWICVAGKTATTMARNLDRMLFKLTGDIPFTKIKKVGAEKLPQTLKDFGIGCYNSKARSMWEIVNSNLDLRTCSIEDLEGIYGIGLKTSRCFVIHSRLGAKCAGLDTHVLKFLRNKGHNVPTSTPGSKKKYLEVEKLFLRYVYESGKTVADFDLDVWKSYAVGGENNG